MNLEFDLLAEENLAHGNNVRFNKTSIKPLNAKISPDGSIVLIGLPGVGKSTLAVIASTYLKMRLIETERCFRTMTGLSGPEYAEKYGKQALLSKEAEVLGNILRKHSKKCVIAVASRTSNISTCWKLLQEFAASHVLIHVVRDFEQVALHLKDQIHKKELLEMWRYIIPRCRSLAQFEFYVKDLKYQRFQDNGHHLPHFLCLKPLERNFQLLLDTIYVEARASVFLPPPEEIDFSKVLVIPFLQISNNIIDIDMIYGVHLVKIELKLSSINHMDWDSLLTLVSATCATVRSSTSDIPLALSISDGFGQNEAEGMNETKYFGLLQHAISLGFEYCYLDLGAPKRKLVDFMTISRTAKYIGKWHNSPAHDSKSSTAQWWRDSECIDIYKMALDLGCHALQLSSPALSIEDNFDIVNFPQRVLEKFDFKGPKVSVFNTGELGKLSRVLNRTLNPVTAKSLVPNHSGTLDSRDLNTELDGTFTLEELQHTLSNVSMQPSLHFCSFGADISHSIAPAMHNAGFSALGLRHRYGLVESDELKLVVGVMHFTNFGGLSCANPYKQAIIPLLDDISPHALAIKAVNTVYPCQSNAGKDRILYGENTDWIGLTSCVRNYLSPINAVTHKTTALVIGAGGMSHAAIYALLRMGLKKILVWNRTISTAETLAAHFHQVYQSLNEKNNATLESTDDVISVLATLQDTELFRREISPPTIIINTLADGKRGEVASSFDLPIQWFSNPTGGVYVQSAYKIPDSTLSRKVGDLLSKNWIAVGGRELLLEQAFPQTELWTRLSAPKLIMRRAAGVKRVWDK